MKRLALSRRNAPWVLFGVSLFVLAGQEWGWFARVQTLAEQSQPGLYKVVKFDDGDTIVVDMNGKDETIRFIGVDTPETHDPRKSVQCYGQMAAAYTRKIIGEQRVRLTSDSLSTDRDRYNRLLRYVYLPDGSLVNEALIQGGYGFAYTYFPFTKSQQFAADEQRAKAAGNGLWSACTVQALSSGQLQTNAVAQ